MCGYCTKNDDVIHNLCVQIHGDESQKKSIEQSSLIFVTKGVSKKYTASQNLFTVIGISKRKKCQCGSPKCAYSSVKITHKMDDLKTCTDYFNSGRVRRFLHRSPKCDGFCGHKI